MSKQKKLPQQIIPFMSEDKNWHQKEDLDDIANIPSPVVCIIFGNMNVGKSRTLKNLLIHKNPNYERVVIYSPLRETKEYDKIDAEIVREVPSLDDFDSNVRNCLILEDVSGKSLKKIEKERLNELFRVGSSHQQIDIYCITSDVNQYTPEQRRLANTIIMWRNNDSRQLSEIAQKFNIEVSMIKYIFKNICTSPYDSFMICNVTPSAKYRKNVFEKLIL